MADVTTEFPLQRYLSNPIDPAAAEHRWIAGIIGERPSLYAKSPRLWNAAFQALKLDAIFLPFDVAESNLEPLVQVMRESSQLVGFSVAVPYKIRITGLLDELDPKARQIGAVNTVVRTPEGRLIGYNTDGQGAIDSLVRRLPGQPSSFAEPLSGLRVLLIGAGGAARAAAVYLGEAIGPSGRLVITNRTPQTAVALAREVVQLFHNASAVTAESLEREASAADLIINATVLGQTGIRRLPDGRATSLEPYSPLAPANPAALPLADFEDERAFYAAWFAASLRDIELNHLQSATTLQHVPCSSRCFDLNYAPLETTLLVQARLSGKRTLNGKGMNIAQAADAFVSHVMRSHLLAVGLEPETCYQTVWETMAAIW